MRQRSDNICRFHIEKMHKWHMTYVVECSHFIETEFHCQIVFDKASLENYNYFCDVAACLFS